MFHFTRRRAKSEVAEWATYKKNGKSTQHTAHTHTHTDGASNAHRAQCDVAYALALVCSLCAYIGCGLCVRVCACVCGTSVSVHSVYYKMVRCCWCARRTDFVFGIVRVFWTLLWYFFFAALPGLACRCDCSYSMSRYRARSHRRCHSSDTQTSIMYSHCVLVPLSPSLSLSLHRSPPLCRKWLLTLRRIVDNDNNNTLHAEAKAKKRRKKNVL